MITPAGCDSNNHGPGYSVSSWRGEILVSSTRAVMSDIYCEARAAPLTDLGRHSLPVALHPRGASRSTKRRVSSDFCTLPIALRGSSSITQSKLGSL